MECGPPPDLGQRSKTISSVFFSVNSEVMSLTELVEEQERMQFLTDPKTWWVIYTGETNRSSTKGGKVKLTTQGKTRLSK